MGTLFRRGTQYLNRLRALYNKYFRDRKKYLSEYKKYESEYLTGMLDLHNKALSGISTLLNRRISAANDAKSAAIDAISEEKEARLDALNAEKEARIDLVETKKKELEAEEKLIDKQIKAKNKIIDGIREEIKAAQDLNSQRKQALNLQQDEYNLQRLLNQNTKQVYTEEGFKFVADTSGVREARQKIEDDKLEIEISQKEKQIDLIEKEIDLLNEKKDAISEQMSLLDEETGRINDYYDDMIKDTEKYYNNLIEQQEKYWDSIIRGIEQTKSRYEELAEVEEVAKAFSYIQQVFGDLGYTVEDVLNGSDAAFEDFKSRYISVINDMNSNSDFTDGLVRATGIAKENLGSFLDKTKETAEGIDTLGEKGSELDTVAEGMDGIAESASIADTNVSNVASATDTVATNVSDVNTNIGETTGLINEEKGAFDDLKQTIDLIVEAINKKIQAIETEQSTVSSAVGSEMANFQLLINKILEVKEKLDAVNDTVATMDRQPIDNLASAFQLLYDKLLLVSNLLGVSAEGEGAVNGISGAIQALNEISLEEGIIAQFTNLKTAIDSVTAAISGGGGESSEGSGSGGTSGSKGGKQGGSGSKGGKGSEGESGGGNSLTGAITEMGNKAKEVIGEPDAEGDGTVIGEFGSMETAVNDVRDAIGTGDSEGSTGSSKASEGDGTLIGSIEDLGEKTVEVLGEPGGEGVIGRFEQFKEPIREADEHVHSISDGLDAIDGKEVECTITVNVKQNGSAYAEGTVLGSMNLESGEYTAQYGKAFAGGTGKYEGLPKAEKNALVSEYGQTEMTVLPDGKTIITDEPTMMDLPKDTVIYNEEQTKKIMDNKIDASGNAHADGTDDTIWTTLADGSKVRPLQPGDKMWDLYHAFDAYLKSIDGNLEKLVPNSFYEQNREWNKLADQISYANNIVNNNKNQPVTVNQNVTLNCPNLTNNSGVEYVQKELGHLSQMALQVPLRDY